MITSQHVKEEIPTPDEVEKMEEPKMGLLIYKAVYMAIRLLLDVRRNTDTSNRKPRTRKPDPEKVDNPVLKDDVKIK